MRRASAFAVSKTSATACRPSSISSRKSWLTPARKKSVLFERQANVGLKGAFGSAILGRTKNIVDGAQNRVEPFGVNGVVGKVDEALMRVGVSSARVSNALAYSTPKLRGFGASAQYVLSEVNGARASRSAPTCMRTPAANR